MNEGKISADNNGVMLIGTSGNQIRKKQEIGNRK